MRRNTRRPAAPYRLVVEALDERYLLSGLGDGIDSVTGAEHDSPMLDTPSVREVGLPEMQPNKSPDPGSPDISSPDQREKGQSKTGDKLPGRDREDETPKDAHKV